MVLYVEILYQWLVRAMIQINHEYISAEYENDHCVGLDYLTYALAFFILCIFPRKICVKENQVEKYVTENRNLSVCRWLFMHSRGLLKYLSLRALQL